MLDKPAELQNVTKRYGATTALDDLSLDIAPGELVALLGPNGAGKTTAVRLLLGLARPDAGKATVFGANPRSAKTRRRIGAMLQVGKVPETLKVREHIELFSVYYERPLPFSTVLDASGLRGIEEKLFGELSGGQKQRVLFALAICGDPDLLILDEPTVGLDIDSRRGIWDEVRQFVSRGKSVLLTTHYLDEADALSDRIMVIDHGRLIANGSPADIKSRVASRRIRCATALPLEVVRALPFVSRATQNGSTTEIVVTDSDAVLRELLRRDAAVSIHELVGAGLEEAFLSLTHAQMEKVA
jgi:ABC-2 type transport system ATP-binding protein